MSDTGQWHVLQQPQETSGLFLIKWAFLESNYEVYVTNLSQIWAEKLDHSAVLKRARDSASSIDPSENAQQLQKLFEKLASALREEKSTSLILKHDKLRDKISLDLEIPLPAPLSDIHWTITLSEQDPEEVGSHVTEPLVKTLYQRDDQVNQLKALIKDKDHVLNRLLDRLESSGTDLTTVFPGTAGIKSSRKVSRTQLARYVKGLEAFDPSTWQPASAPLQSKSELAAVFDGISATNDTEDLAKILGLDESSLRRVSPGSQQLVRDSNDLDRQSAASDTESEDDEFQLQSSPVKADDRAKPPNPDSSSQSPSPTKSYGRSHSPDGTRTQQSPATPKARFGRIGGGKAKAKPSSTPEQESDGEPKQQTSPTRSVSTPTKKAKLGIVGKRRDRGQEDSPVATKTSKPSEPAPNNSRKAPDPGKSTAKPEQNSDEAADIRRNELKRQLASQATAASKKKRKF